MLDEENDELEYEEIVRGETMKAEDLFILASSHLESVISKLSKNQLRQQQSVKSDNCQMSNLALVCCCLVSLFADSDF